MRRISIVPVWSAKKSFHPKFLCDRQSSQRRMSFSSVWWMSLKIVNCEVDESFSFRENRSNLSHKIQRNHGSLKIQDNQDLADLPEMYEEIYAGEGNVQGDFLIL